MNFVLQIHSFIFNDVVPMSSITHLTRYLCQSWATTSNQEITSPYQIPTVHQEPKLQKMFCNLKFHNFAKLFQRLYTYGPPSKFQIRFLRPEAESKTACGHNFSRRSTFWRRATSATFSHLGLKLQASFACTDNARCRIHPAHICLLNHLNSVWIVRLFPVRPLNTSTTACWHHHQKCSVWMFQYARVTFDV